MNPDFSKPPREEWEVRLTALLLGELSPAESDEVRQAMEKDPALTRLYEQLKRTVEMVREASISSETKTSPLPAQLKLSAGKREQLLQRLKTSPIPQPAIAVNRWKRWYVPASLAATVMGLLALVAALIPQFVKSRSASQMVTRYQSERLATAVLPPPERNMLSMEENEPAHSTEPLFELASKTRENEVREKSSVVKFAEGDPARLEGGGQQGQLEGNRNLVRFGKRARVQSAGQTDDQPERTSPTATAGTSVLEAGSKMVVDSKELAKAMPRKGGVDLYLPQAAVEDDFKQELTVANGRPEAAAKPGWSGSLGTLGPMPAPATRPVEASPSRPTEPEIAQTELYARRLDDAKPTKDLRWAFGDATRETGGNGGAGFAGAAGSYGSFGGGKGGGGGRGATTGSGSKPVDSAGRNRWDVQGDNFFALVPPATTVAPPTQWFDNNGVAQAKLEPLAIQVPMPSFKGTPTDLPAILNPAPAPATPPVVAATVASDETKRGESLHFFRGGDGASLVASIEKAMDGKPVVEQRLSDAGRESTLRLNVVPTDGIDTLDLTRKQPVSPASTTAAKSEGVDAKQNLDHAKGGARTPLHNKLTSIEANWTEKPSLGDVPLVGGLMRDKSINLGNVEPATGLPAPTIPSPPALNQPTPLAARPAPEPGRLAAGKPQTAAASLRGFYNDSENALPQPDLAPGSPAASAGFLLKSGKPEPGNPPALRNEVVAPPADVSGKLVDKEAVRHLEVDGDFSANLEKDRASAAEKGKSLTVGVESLRKAIPTEAPKQDSTVALGYDYSAPKEVQLQTDPAQEPQTMGENRKDAGNRLHGATKAGGEAEERLQRRAGLTQRDDEALTATRISPGLNGVRQAGTDEGKRRLSEDDARFSASEKLTSYGLELRDQSSMDARQPGQDGQAQLGRKTANEEQVARRGRSAVAGGMFKAKLEPATSAPLTTEQMADLDARIPKSFNFEIAPVAKEDAGRSGLWQRLLGRKSTAPAPAIILSTNALSAAHDFAHAVTDFDSSGVERYFSKAPAAGKKVQIALPQSGEQTAKTDLSESKQLVESTIQAVTVDGFSAGDLTVAKREDVPVQRVTPPNAPTPQPEIQTQDNPFSTFSLNVSDVSFKLAAASLEKGVMPDPATIRSEEFINAFDYREPEPAPGVPVAFAWERARYDFAHNRDLLRFSVKTAARGREAGKPFNLVLLLDNSGSMERADRVRILRACLRVLVDQLRPQDMVSVITFSRTARLWIDGVTADQLGNLDERVEGLAPQGGTNLEEAMNLAYATALRHYLASGINRVVLLTDGAANLGNVEPETLKQKVEQHRKQGVALDCFGIGWEGYNDDLLEVLSRNGDGRYGFVNAPEDAASEFAGQLAGALQVAASDVKVQVEFNPRRVIGYRQIGYAKHQLKKEQFRDNTIDAAELGAAEAGNALYAVEVNPRGEGNLATVRVRFKIPGTSDYREHEWAVPFSGNPAPMGQASPAMRLASTASAFSEWLASSPFAGEVTPDRLLANLAGVPEVFGADPRPKKLEWMIRQAKSLAGQQ